MIKLEIQTDREPIWKEHNGVEYIEMIITGLKSTEAIISYYTKGCEMMLERPDKNVMVYIDKRGVKVNTKTMRMLQEIGKNTQRAIKKSVLVGNPGISAVMFKLYVAYTRSPVKFFTNPDAALKYLTDS